MVDQMQLKPQDAKPQIKRDYCFWQMCVCVQWFSTGEIFGNIWRQPEVGATSICWVEIKDAKNSRVHRTALLSDGKQLPNTKCQQYQGWKFLLGKSLQVFIRNNRSCLREGKLSWLNICAYFLDLFLKSQC
jgi:hypothetical protein